MQKLIALLPVLLLCPANALAQQSMTIGAAKDNTLYQNANGALSNGAGSGIFAGVNNGNFSPQIIRRGLIAFDVAAAIPAGSTITGVQLHMVLVASNAGFLPVTLHPVLADWGEAGSVAGLGGGGGGPSQPGDATWVHTFSPGSSWSNLGGDFNPTSSATQSVGSSPGANVVWGSTLQLVTDVQSWLDTPSNNFGWMLRAPESGGTSSKKFASREGFYPPALTIDYLPAVGACLSIATSATIGNPLTVSLQSPAANAPCYVFAHTQTANLLLGTIGSTTYYSHLALGPSVLSLADPTNTYGPSLTNPVTDANGDWSITVAVPNNPSLQGVTYYSEGFVQDPSLLPTGLFWQTNLLTVTIQ